MGSRLPTRYHSIARRKENDPAARGEGWVTRARRASRELEAKLRPRKDRERDDARLAEGARELGGDVDPRRPREVVGHAEAYERAGREARTDGRVQADLEEGLHLLGSEVGPVAGARGEEHALPLRIVERAERDVRADDQLAALPRHV